MEKQTIVIALLLLLAVFGLPAAANYAVDGFPLTTSSTGTVYGGVYTGVGDNDADGSAEITNYTTNYTLPDGIDVKWARVYVDAWGGNPNNPGWINVSFNGGPWQSEYYNETNSTNPHCWGSGNGVVLTWFDQTNNVTSGINRIDARSTIFNGRIFRIVLVCAYNDTDGCGHLVNYWVNDGNYNLHYDCGAGSTDSTTTSFNGMAYNATAGLDEVCCAKLTTVYHASGGGSNGQASEPDYLYFNVIPTSTDHSPYYHHPNQLGDDGDVYYGDDDYADGQQWTMKSECVKPLLSPTNNNATWWRGYNASDGAIYHNDSYTEPAGAEGEAYLHPMLAVLTVETTKHHVTKGMVGGGVDNFFGLPLMDNEPIGTALSSIDSQYTNVYRYNSTTQQWESYNKNLPFPPFSDFTVLDPVIGYAVAPTGACTLTWTSE